ncbi:hypothetical protein Tco_0981086 [Tanacetum coccineum]
MFVPQIQYITDSTLQVVGAKAMVAHTKKKITPEGQKDENLNIVKLQRLDVGEGKEVDLKECPRSKLLTEKERKVSSFKFSSWRSDFSYRKA